MMGKQRTSDVAARDHTERSPLLVLVDNDRAEDHNHSVKQRIETFRDDRDQRNSCLDQAAEVEVEPTSRFTPFSRLDGKDQRVLILLLLTNIVNVCALSMLPPFYPSEAGSRNIPVSATGFVFCVFQPVHSIAGHVITERFLPRFGVKAIYIISLLSATAGCFLFSTLGLLDPTMRWQFILTSMLCRFVQAMGTSGIRVSSSTILSVPLPIQQSAVSALRWADCGTTVAYVIGPPISGYLYYIGGFSLPFYVTGALTLFTGVLFYLSASFPDQAELRCVRSKRFVMCSFDIMSADRHVSSSNQPSTRMTMFSAASVFTCAASTTSLDPILLNHVVDIFGFSIPIVGLLFAIPPSVGAIFTPIWRCLVEDEDIQTSCHLFGLLFIASGSLVLGPTPLLELIPDEVWTVIVGLVLIGAGTSCVLILSMTLLGGRDSSEGIQERDRRVKHNTLKPKLEESESESENRVFSCSYLLGATLGPVLGSVLVEFSRFRITTSVIASLSLVCIIFYIFISIMSCFRKKCGCMCPGSRHNHDIATHIMVDCEKCALRRLDGTFGVLPFQSVKV